MESVISWACSMFPEHYPYISNKLLIITGCQSTLVFAHIGNGSSQDLFAFINFAGL